MSADESFDPSEARESNETIEDAHDRLALAIDAASIGTFYCMFLQLKSVLTTLAKFDRDGQRCAR